MRDPQLSTQNGRFSKLSTESHPLPSPALPVDPYITTRSTGTHNYIHLQRQSPVNNSSLNPYRDGDLDKNILILSNFHNSHSFGKNRTFTSYLQTIESIDYPRHLLSLGFLISDYEDYEAFIPEFEQFVRRHNLAAASLILYIREEPFSRKDRHRPDIQKSRRSFLAQLRNRLLMSTLRDEDGVLWIDSDIIEIQSDALKQFVRSGLDIITPFCRFGTDGMSNFDANAWVGKRTRPNEQQWKDIKDGRKTDFVPMHDGSEFVSDWINKEDRVAELDSVGGTVLYVRADVHRNGVNFPPFYLIGSDWDAKYGGYDGIETEGLCYIARTIGYRCWAMPHITVSHTAQQENPKPKGNAE
ncbi:Anp1-domain-containing protein [Polychytrium aggregatum]|uniref:Anp1-domain-containing protein n=1 Tax=Polychytrium aggregatum TaxID=110093 RepID=UPI0022FE9E14|nr:Anp1-domain-containing protein [Polychytrium aggregatum]XP_052963398.1 Anp1-domain-containing protein [Polychytrium aggregatum]KAI9190848.1 Anp1-domain-containing protein [Polychytrium aggregatum]KAI9199415.1 Anp1-domain-containing protein [Polychytrium aggregatum]